MRLAILLLAFLSLSAVAQADGSEIPPLSPRTAKTMSMGGSFVSVSKGFDALFTNPAGYAASKGELTILALNPWLYVRPLLGDLESMNSVSRGIFSGDVGPAIDPAENLIKGNGLGAGAMAGIGWVGNNLGIGVYAIQDAYLSGPGFLEATGQVDLEVGIVVGYALPFAIGPAVLKVGGDLRPNYRLRGTADSATMAAILASSSDFKAIMAAVPAVSGLSLSVDLGASLDIGPWTLGLAVRDITPAMNYVEGDEAEFLDSLSRGALPGSDGRRAAVYWTLPDIFLGASFHFGASGISWLRNPAIHLEIRDPIRVIMEKESALNLVHIGAEAGILSFMTVRAGINRGYLSGGIGFDFPGFELNAAVFTEELGAYPGERARTGVSLEVAVRLDSRAKDKEKSSE